MHKEAELPSRSSAVMFAHCNLNNRFHSQYKFDIYLLPVSTVIGRCIVYDLLYTIGFLMHACKYLECKKAGWQSWSSADMLDRYNLYNEFCTIIQICYTVWFLPFAYLWVNFPNLLCPWLRVSSVRGTCSYSHSCLLPRWETRHSENYSATFIREKSSSGNRVAVTSSSFPCYKLTTPK